MSKLQFGETVNGYSIPVLNEREIRASSGILFMFAFMSLMMIAFKGDFLLAKYFVTFFLLDFIIRLFVSPKYSPALIIGRLIVRNQTPEYVGAPQKKFAWRIGLVLASTMFILMVIMNSYSIITGLICLICLIFLSFESAFGICIGCLFYGWFYKEKAQYCPGEICDVNQKDDIQKTSTSQILVMIGFLVTITITVVLLGDVLGTKPSDLWEILNLK